MNRYYTIIDLLNKLSNDYRYLTWKINCNNVNGLGKTILEILIYEFPHELLKRKIAFQLESGKVLNHNIKELRGSTDSIVDLLLDLINLERKGLGFKVSK